VTFSVDNLCPKIPDSVKPNQTRLVQTITVSRLDVPDREEKKFQDKNNDK